MRLRPYQAEAIARIDEAFASHDSALVVLPTGCGKTIVFATAIDRLGGRGRALVIAHREELIAQAAQKIHAVTGVSPQIEMAVHWATPEWLDWDHAPTRVIVSSVQTLSTGRMKRFASGFDLLVIDEAHHAPAESYRRIIEHFRAINPEMRVLGVTATPDRADELALGSVFETVAHSYDIADAVTDGWLTPIRQTSVNVAGLDYSSVRTTAGDLNGADLSKILNEEKTLHQIAHPTIEVARGRRAIVFCASVEQATRIGEIINRWKGGSAAMVSGETPKLERQAILSRFARGQTQFLCNCGVLTEGFDDPGVEVVVLARPTKSRALFAQMVGRGTRPLPGIVDGPETAADRVAAIAASAKPCCEVIDFVGNTGRHRLISVSDILGGNDPEPVRDLAAEIARKAGRGADVESALAEARARIEEERRRAEEEAERRAAAKKLRDEQIAREAARRANLRARADYRTSTVDPFEVLGVRRDPAALAKWTGSGRPISDKQAQMLARSGIDPRSLNGDEARRLCQEIIARFKTGKCTFKQAAILRKNGLDPNMSKADATKALDAIFKKTYTAPAEPRQYPVSTEVF
jgi:superfamily II DNA or RNA helicase